MSIKAIFWDNDGVLVDTEHLYYESNRLVFKDEGFDFSMAEYKQISLKEGRSALELLLEQGYTGSQIEQLRLKRNQVFSDLLTTNNEELLIDGVQQTLESLRDHYLMAIVTSCRKEHFNIIHQRTGTLDYFDFVLANGDYPRSKPNPDPYLCALKRSGLRKDECVVIEDTERGLDAAVAAGIRCLVIPTELTRENKFQGATGILQSIDQVPAALQTM